MLPALISSRTRPVCSFPIVLFNHNFYILNSETEEERELVANDSVGWMFNAGYSPVGGDNVVIFWNRHKPGLWLVSLADSSQTLLYPGSVKPIMWSEDGRWIYAWDKSSKPYKIIMVQLQSGKSKPLVTLPFNRLDSWGIPITMTLDGRRIICAVTESQSDIWLMENFDPEVN